MPLHSRDTIRDEMFDDVYSSTDMTVSAPKYRFPDQERPAEHIYAMVHDELMLDGNSRMNLATFCQTWSEAEVQRLLAECWDKNMIDKDEYPQTAELERPLRPHAGRSVELAPGGKHRWLLDDRI